MTIQAPAEQMQKHSDERYINVALFEGEEAQITCRTVAIRTARKAHVCFGNEGRSDHQIHRGDRYRHERALVDGDYWGEYRMCIPCLDKHIAEYEGDECPPPTPILTSPATERGFPFLSS